MLRLTFISLARNRMSRTTFFRIKCPFPECNALVPEGWYHQDQDLFVCSGCISKILTRTSGTSQRTCGVLVSSCTHSLLYVCDVAGEWEKHPPSELFKRFYPEDWDDTLQHTATWIAEHPRRQGNANANASAPCHRLQPWRPR